MSRDLDSLAATVDDLDAAAARKLPAPMSRANGLPCVRSEDLIGGNREIMIEHGGGYYRLRITRANKLILTK